MSDGLPDFPLDLADPGTKNKELREEKVNKQFNVRDFTYWFAIQAKRTLLREKNITSLNVILTSTAVICEKM